MFLVDSHCHLHLLADKNTQAVLNRARELQVKYFLNITIAEAEVPLVKKICEQHEGVVCSVGIHPCEVLKVEHLTTEQIIEWTKHPKVVAIGESGFDFHYERETASQQQKLFEQHIHAAQETGLPLIVHSRAAEQETMKILKKEQQTKKFPVVLHCFTGSRAMAEEALSFGFTLGATGVITFTRKAETLQEVFKEAPLEQILVETDSPYLAPHPFRGKPNEPALVYYTAKKLSEIKQLAFTEIMKQTTKNFFNLCNPHVNS